MQQVPARAQTPIWEYNPQSGNVAEASLHSVSRFLLAVLVEKIWLIIFIKKFFFGGFPAKIPKRTFRGKTRKRSRSGIKTRASWMARDNVRPVFLFPDMHRHDTRLTPSSSMCLLWIAIFAQPMYIMLSLLHTFYFTFSRVR